jgi:hypothetical protein
MDDLNIGVHNRWQHFECLLWRFHDWVVWSRWTGSWSTSADL